jgi:hypothetical protein
MKRIVLCVLTLAEYFSEYATRTPLVVDYLQDR